MPSDTNLLTTKTNNKTTVAESRCLAVANLPESATEENVKDYFKKYGRVHTVKLELSDDQRYAFVGYLDVRTASKAHNSENILDGKKLRTAFHDGSISVPKALLEPLELQMTTSETSGSITNTSIDNNNVTVTNSSSSTLTPTHHSSGHHHPTTLSSTVIGKNQTHVEKRSSRIACSPDENTRHQVVPVKRDDSGSSGSKRKTSTSAIKNSGVHPTVINSKSRNKHGSSNSSSTSSDSDFSDDSSTHNRRRSTKTTGVNGHGKTKIIKISNLPQKMPLSALRENLLTLYAEFKKAGRLVTLKIESDSDKRHALITFRKNEDVEKALLHSQNKLIGTNRIRAEPYDASTDNDDYDTVKRGGGSETDVDEYSAKATRTLYIGNLEPDISYNDLRETFSKYGDIIEVEIKRQQQSQHPLTFAFVQYADIKSVVKAMKAMDSKLLRDHPIKLGFGKSQPTNVLWLGELPLNVTDHTIRSFVIRTVVTIQSDQVLDIYVDNRNKGQAQGLVYFADTRVAQEVINHIRGKKLDNRRIQVDYASKVFITRFSDVIEEASTKKNFVAYTSEPLYLAETRTGTKRSVTRDPLELPSYDTTRERWPLSYKEPSSYNRTHKSDVRHPPDRRHSKDYTKMHHRDTTPNSAPVAAIGNSDISPANSNTLLSTILPASSVAPMSTASHRRRLSTSSKDSVSNAFNTSISSTALLSGKQSHTHHSSTSSSRSSSSDRGERNNSRQKHTTKSISGNNNNISSSSSILVTKKKKIIDSGVSSHRKPKLTKDKRERNRKRLRHVNHHSSQAAHNSTAFSSTVQTLTVSTSIPTPITTLTSTLTPRRLSQEQTMKNTSISSISPTTTGTITITTNNLNPTDSKILTLSSCSTIASAVTEPAIAVMMTSPIPISTLISPTLKKEQLQNNKSSGLPSTSCVSPSSMLVLSNVKPSSPKVLRKDPQLVFDWLMQNHHNNNNGVIDNGEDDDILLESGTETMNKMIATNINKTSTSSNTTKTNETQRNIDTSKNVKNFKEDKSPVTTTVTSAYRLQPIRKREDQTEPILNASPSYDILNQLSTSSVELLNEKKADDLLSSSSNHVSNNSGGIVEDDTNDMHLTHNVNRRLPTSSQPNKSLHVISNNTMPKDIPLEPVYNYDLIDVRLQSSSNNTTNNLDNLRLPFPQFAFDLVKSMPTANVLVVLNPKAHLKHSTLGISNSGNVSLIGKQSSDKISDSTTADSTDNNNNSTYGITLPALTTPHIDLSQITTFRSDVGDDDSPTNRIPLDERIRLLDKQIYEINHSITASTTSTSPTRPILSSSISGAKIQTSTVNSNKTVVPPLSTTALSPSTLLSTTMEQQKLLLLKRSTPTSVTSTQSSSSPAISASVKSLSELVSSLSSSSSASQTLSQCIQAVRSAPLTSTFNSFPTKALPYSYSTQHRNGTPTLVPIPSTSTVTSMSSFSTIPSLLTSSNIYASHKSSDQQTTTNTSLLSSIQDILQRNSIVSIPSILNSSSSSSAITSIAPSLSLTNISSLTHRALANCSVANSLLSTTTSASITPSKSLSSISQQTSIFFPGTKVNQQLSEISPSEPITPVYNSDFDGLNNNDLSSIIEPSTSSAKIIERLGPSARVKRKQQPSQQPTVQTSDSNKISLLPDIVHPHLQQQLSVSSNSSQGLKSILKQRSVPSSPVVTSPTNDRKASTTYVSPLSSTTSSTPDSNTSFNRQLLSRSQTPTTSVVTTNPLASLATADVLKNDGSLKKKVQQNIKKHGENENENEPITMFTNDIDERVKMENTNDSSWRTLPTTTNKQRALSSSSSGTATAVTSLDNTKKLSSPVTPNKPSSTFDIKKQTLDKIPKKLTAIDQSKQNQVITSKSIDNTIVKKLHSDSISSESSNNTSVNATKSDTNLLKKTKPSTTNKQIASSKTLTTTSLIKKVPQLTIERIDTKSLKNVFDIKQHSKLSSTSSTPTTTSPVKTNQHKRKSHQVSSDEEHEKRHDNKKKSTINNQIERRKRNKKKLQQKLLKYTSEKKEKHEQTNKSRKKHSIKKVINNNSSSDNDNDLGDYHIKQENNDEQQTIRQLDHEEQVAGENDDDSKQRPTSAKTLFEQKEEDDEERQSFHEAESSDQEEMKNCTDNDNETEKKNSNDSEVSNSGDEEKHKRSKTGLTRSKLLQKRQRTKQKLKKLHKSFASRELRGLNLNSLVQDVSMYDRIKKRARSDHHHHHHRKGHQHHHRSRSSSQQNSSENDDTEDSDNDSQSQSSSKRTTKHKRDRISTTVSELSDSELSDSELSDKSTSNLSDDRQHHTKSLNNKQNFVFDDNVFDAEESDNDLKMNRKKLDDQKKTIKPSQSHLSPLLSQKSNTATIPKSNVISDQTKKTPSDSKSSLSSSKTVEKKKQFSLNSQQVNDKKVNTSTKVGKVSEDVEKKPSLTSTKNKSILNVNRSTINEKVVPKQQSTVVAQVCRSTDQKKPIKVNDQSVNKALKTDVSKIKPLSPVQQPLSSSSNKSTHIQQQKPTSPVIKSSSTKVSIIGGQKRSSTDDLSSLSSPNEAKKIKLNENTIKVNKQKPINTHVTNKTREPSTKQIKSSSSPINTDKKTLKSNVIENIQSSLAMENSEHIEETPSTIVSLPTVDIPSEKENDNNLLDASTNDSANKFGIVFTSHHRTSALQISQSFSRRTQSIDHISIGSYDISKTGDVENNNKIRARAQTDNSELPLIKETPLLELSAQQPQLIPIIKQETSQASSSSIISQSLIKTAAIPQLNDDDTLNPETMQLSDLLLGRRDDSASTKTKNSSGKKGVNQQLSTKKQQIRTSTNNTTSIAAVDAQLSTNNDETISKSLSSPSELQTATILKHSSIDDSHHSPSHRRSSDEMTASENINNGTSSNDNRNCVTSISAPLRSNNSKRFRTDNDHIIQIKSEPIEEQQRSDSSKSLTSSDIPVVIKQENIEINITTKDIQNDNENNEVPINVPLSEYENANQQMECEALKNSDNNQSEQPPSTQNDEQLQLDSKKEDEKQTMDTETAPSQETSTTISSVISSTTKTNLNSETENAIQALLFSSVQCTSIPRRHSSETPPLNSTATPPPLPPAPAPVLAPVPLPPPSSLTITKTVTEEMVIAEPNTIGIVNVQPPTTSSSMNESVEETLNAVNSLLMLNNRADIPAVVNSEHQKTETNSKIICQTISAAPTISTPIYNVVTSLPSPSTNRSTNRDLMTLVSNIVGTTSTSSSLSTIEKHQRSHIEEIIDDVAKGHTSSPSTHETTSSTTMSIIDPFSFTSNDSHLRYQQKDQTIKPFRELPLPTMKTPCPTTLSSGNSDFSCANIFGNNSDNNNSIINNNLLSTETSRSSTSPSTTTTTVPLLARPSVSNTPTRETSSSSPSNKNTEQQHLLNAAAQLFPHMLTPDGTFSQHFPFPFLSSSSHNSPNQASNIVSATFSTSPPSANNTTMNNKAQLSSNNVVLSNPFPNMLLSSENSTNSTNKLTLINDTLRNTSSSSSYHHSNLHSNSEIPLTKTQRSSVGGRESLTKSSTPTTSNRSTPIQQTVPVPIALSIPANIQLQQQTSPLINQSESHDRTGGNVRQQASPMQQFLAQDSVVPFRPIYDASDLYNAQALYPQNFAYAAAAASMLNVIGVNPNAYTDNFIYVNPTRPDSHPLPIQQLFQQTANSPNTIGSNNSNTSVGYMPGYSVLNFRQPLPPSPPQHVNDTFSSSRDPYSVTWQGYLILKNDQAYVKTILVAGSPQIARASMNFWNTDSQIPSNQPQSPSTHNLRISQRMRLEQAQLEGVQKRMQMENDHCILIAMPNGSTPQEYQQQQSNLKNGVIKYFEEKKAAGIVNVLLPGASQAAYVVHIFPPCPFASEILQSRAPDTYRCVVQNRTDQCYLLIVITTVQ